MLSPMTRSSRPTLFDGRGRKLSWHPGGYQAAGFARSRSFISAQVTDFRRELDSYTRTELVRKARYLKKNVGMIRGVAKSLVDAAVGPGVFPIPATKDKFWNAASWEYIMEVAKIAEVSGKMTLWETQRVRTSAKFFDGEIFTILTKSESGWPQQQVVRCHRVGSFDVDEEDGWCDGVKLDGKLRPRAYRFSLRGDDNYLTVPAQSVVHSYLLEESDQVRGVTPLAHAINGLHDIMDTLALEKESVKDLSRTARVITTQSGEYEEEPSDHFDEATGREENEESTLPLEKIFGSEIARLKLGEKLEAFRSDRPSPAFLGFLDYIGRDVTTGVGFPYEYSWDPKGIPGPAVRFILDKARKSSDEWFRNEVEDTFPFYTFAIACGIEQGHLKRNPEWYKVEWLKGAEDLTIDQGRDSKAAIENLKSGLDNFKRAFARRGLWWETELAQKAQEAQFIDVLANEYGISVDRIHQLAPNNSGDAAASNGPGGASAESEE
jgi:hypothetical protein